MLSATHRVLLRVLTTLAAAAVTAACGGPTSPFGEALLRVESVEVLILLSFPAQVSARVQGVLPTPCHSVGRIEQQRRGHTITVTIATASPEPGVSCIQVVTPVTQTIRLEGAFTPGDYVLRVNGVERAFHI